MIITGKVIDYKDVYERIMGDILFNLDSSMSNTCEISKLEKKADKLSEWFDNDVHTDDDIY